MVWDPVDPEVFSRAERWGGTCLEEELGVVREGGVVVVAAAGTGIHPSAHRKMHSRTTTSPKCEAVLRRART